MGSLFVKNSPRYCWSEINTYTKCQIKSATILYIVTYTVFVFLRLYAKKKRIQNKQTKNEPQLPITESRGSTLPIPILLTTKGEKRGCLVESHLTSVFFPLTNDVCWLQSKQWYILQWQNCFNNNILKKKEKPLILKEVLPPMRF